MMKQDQKIKSLKPLKQIMTDDTIKRYLIVLFLSSMLAIVIGREFIFSSGYIYLGEQFEVFTVGNFWKVVYPLWNEKVQMFNLTSLPKMYLYASLVLIAKLFNSYKLLQSLILTLPFVVGFISAFKLTEYVISNSIKINKIPWDYIFFSALLASFIFTINPWVAVHPRDIFLRFQYAFLPLILYIFIRLLESNDNRYAIYFAMLMALIGGYRFNFLVSILTLFILAIYLFFENRGWRVTTSKLSRVLLAYVLLIALSAAKFIPGILHSQFTPVEAVSRFNIGAIGREPLLHIFSTKIYKGVWFAFSATYSDMLHFLFIPVTFFSLTYLLYKLKNKKIDFYFIFPPLLVIVFVLFSSQKLNLDTLILRTPYHVVIGRLLRHADWNVMPIIVSISIMAGLSSLLLLLKFKRLAYPFLIAILILSSISAWPLFTGDMNGFWKPTPPPEDYVKVNNILKKEEKLHHALWFPGHTRNPVWSQQEGVKKASASAGIFPIKSSELPSYHHKLYFFDYYIPLKVSYAKLPLANFQGNLSKIYSLLNAKYLTLHYDGGWVPYDKGLTNEYIKNVSYNISNQTAQLIYRGDYLSTFELKGNPSEFKVRKPLLVTDGGLKDLASITSLVGNRTPAVVFGSELAKVNSIATKTPLIIMSGDNKGISLLNHSKLISPKEETIEFDPSNKWSPSSVDNLAFQTRLWKKEIDWNWQFDYGEGLVLTWAKNATLKIPFEVNKKGNYKFFIRCLENQKGGKLRIRLDNKSIEIKTNSQLDKLMWEDLGTIKLQKGKHSIILENVEGFNAVNIFSLIPEDAYLSQKKQLAEELQGKNIIYLFEAESDLYHKNAEVSERFGSTTSNGRVLGIDSDGLAWQEFEVLKNGSYKMAVRGKGQVDITVDNKIYHLDSQELNLTYFGPFRLERGKHKIEVTPSQDAEFKGLIRSWDFSSEKDYNQWKKTTPENQFNARYDVLHDKNALKTKLYNSTKGWKTIRSPLIPAEPGNTYRFNFKVKGQNAHAVHAKIMEMNGEKKRIEVERISPFIIGNGDFDWKDISQKYTVKNASTKYIQLQIWHGHETKQPLPNEVWVDDVSVWDVGKEEKPCIDVIWLYSTENNETLEDLFSYDESPAEVTSYEKINPTKYRVHVNASAPYMLSFAEGYDPLWVAEVKTSEGVKQYEPVPLYSAINGFWIDETGEYDVVIRYKPQTWFYQGAAVSGTTFIGCVGYLFYDWRRRKEDVWALNLETRWRQMWRRSRRS